MTDSGIQAVQDGSETVSGAVPFQFTVTWRSLTQAERSQVEFAQTAQPNPTETVPRFVTARPNIAPPYAEPAPLLSAPNFSSALDRRSLRNRVALVGLALLLLTVAVAAMRRVEQSSPTPAATPT